VKAILTYHSVDDSGSVVSTSEATFRDHVQWLASGRVRVVPLLELLTTSESEDAVAITFDDGLESFGRIAAPLLLAAGLPVTVFVVSDLVGELSTWSGSRGHGPSFRLLDWAALGALAETDLVEIGAHTRTHPVLTRLDPPNVADEIIGCARRIHEQLGEHPRAFAYPYGAFDEEAERVASATFDLSVTTRLDILKPSAPHHRLPRLDMWYYQSPRRLRSWGTSAFRRHLGARRAARAMRGVLAGGGA